MAATALTVTNAQYGSDRGSRWMVFTATLTNDDGQYVDLGWSDVLHVDIKPQDGTIVRGDLAWDYTSGRLTLKGVLPQATMTVSVRVMGRD